MERAKILLIMLLVAAFGLAASLLILASASRPNAPLLEILLEPVLGGSPLYIPFFFPLGPLLYLTIVLASVVGIMYYLIMPEIRAQNSISRGLTHEAAAEMVMKTMTADERTIVSVLKAHNGRYLQKHIAKEAELSRLKTHRIIARFSARGMATVAKVGNTNEVSLAYWLLPREMD